MSVNKCDKVLDCGCSEFPFKNLSAEGVEPATFFAFDFETITPPLGAPDSWWGTTVGREPCESTISQQDADDCARRGAETDIWNTWKDGGVPIPIFGNNQTQCSFACPAGFDTFVYTVPAGTVIARTQEEADVIAASLCQVRGFESKVCVPTPQPVTIGIVDVIDINDLADNGIIAVELNSGFPGYFFNGSLVALDTVVGTTFGEAFACNSSFQFASENFKPFGGGFDDGIWQTLSAKQVIGNGSSFLPAVTNASKRMTSDGKMVCLQGYYDPATSTFTACASFGAGFSNGQSTSINTDGSNHYVAAFKNSLTIPRGVFRWTVETNALDNVLPLTEDGSGFPRSNGITRSGCVLGTYFVAGATKGFINKSGTGASSIDLGSLGGNVAPNSINDSNIVCGDAASGGQVVPFRWTETGGIKAIPLLGGTISGSAKDINAAGDIVGNMNTALAVSIAFLYRNGTTYRLYDLIPNDQKGLWTSLETATLINDNKQIVGFGTNNGVTKGYIMRVP